MARILFNKNNLVKLSIVLTCIVALGIVIFFIYRSIKPSADDSNNTLRTTTFTVAGKLINKENMPLANHVVLIGGVGSETDSDGNYEVSVGVADNAALLMVEVTDLPNMDKQYKVLEPFESTVLLDYPCQEKSDTPTDDTRPICTTDNQKFQKLDIKVEPI